MSYQFWWDAGFETSLLSIIPPDGELAAASTIEPKSRGKVPGVLGPSGWVGYDWRRRTPSRENVASWKGTGANLGLRTDHYPAVDIDILDADLADAIEQITRDTLGDAPCRVGRAPKRLLLYRTDLPMAKRVLEWTVDGVRQGVDFLGTGTQCVVEGIHPATGKRYSWGEWHPVLLGVPGLTLVTDEQITTLLSRIRDFLDIFGISPAESCVDATERLDVAQTQLVGSVEEVRAAVEAIPNDYADRDSYIRIGVAIKAALPDDPEDAFDIWHEWCDRWEDGDNAPETIEADWQRMRPPFEIGAQYLFDLATQHGDTTRLEAKFTVEDAPEAGDIPVVSDRGGRVLATDAWLLERFVQRHGQEVRYCQKLGGWLLWDGCRWRKDDTSQVEAFMAALAVQSTDDVIARAPSPAKADTLSRWCNSNRAVEQGMALARRYQPLAARVEDFDTDPWLLNTPHGVLDLKAGVLLPPDSSRLITKCTRVAPSFAPATRWPAFLEEVTRGDEALQAYLKRLFGYALTGVTEEEMLAFFWGSGGNGKGTLLKTIFNVLGDYAQTAAMDTFTASEYDRHPTDLAALAGARLVVAQETQEGRSWDEARIKTLTGSDPVTARFMRQDFFTYQPQFKLVFAGNHRPNLQSPDAAMLRRFHLVPFTGVPKIVDTHLKDRLAEEYAQILGWMVEGCQDWLVAGLVPPEAVRRSTQEYFQDSDPVGRWLEERCAFDPEARSIATELFSDYRNWCLSEGEEVLTQNAMGRALTKRGLLRCRMPTTTRERAFQGVALQATGITAAAMLLRGETVPRPAMLH